MLSTAVLAAALTLASAGQVPAPDAAAEAATALRAEREAIRANEAAALEALAAAWDGAGRAGDAAEARAAVEPPPPPIGPVKFVPLPELVPAAETPGRTLPAEVAKLRGESTDALLDLARRAADPRVGQYSLADGCLRGVLARRPEDAEARRLLGYVPHDGGWATPFAAEQLRRGSVPHPTFGWVNADWVPHLDRGELPGIVSNGKPRDWLPAEQADALRADFFKRPWTIDTEHFQIISNAPLAEVIAFGRRLEEFHDLFYSLMADVIGRERLPLAQRLANPKLAPRAPDPRAKHEVWFFSSKAEYVDFLRPLLGPDVDKELGHYLEAGVYNGRRLPGRCYFYRDPAAQIAALGTLHHEASHQLLFEGAGRSNFKRNVGNYWVWEALGTYFETVEPQSDGSLLVGALDGPRVEVFQTLALDGKLYVPIERLTSLGRDGYYDESLAFTEPRSVVPQGIGKTYVYYNESMALAVFLMHVDGGAYRGGFLDYVRAAYDGRVNNSGRTLADFLGVPFDRLDAEFLAALKADRAADAGRR